MCDKWVLLIEFNCNLFLFSFYVSTPSMSIRGQNAQEQWVFVISIAITFYSKFTLPSWNASVKNTRGLNFTRYWWGHFVLDKKNRCVQEIVFHVQGWIGMKQWWIIALIIVMIFFHNGPALPCSSFKIYFSYFMWWIHIWSKYLFLHIVQDVFKVQVIVVVFDSLSYAALKQGRRLERVAPSKGQWIITKLVNKAIVSSFWWKVIFRHAVTSLPSSQRWEL